MAREQPGLWLQRKQCQVAAFFFLKQLCLEKIGRDCCGSKYFTKTFGLRNCNANCIAKIFPGLRKIRWDKGTSPNAQVLPLR